MCIEFTIHIRYKFEKLETSKKLLDRERKQEMGFDRVPTD
jgi:hypothetical protein